MPETQVSPEEREMLHKAAKEVAWLCWGDPMVELLENQSPEDRDRLWRETAQAHGPFSEKITGLRQALKNVHVIKRTYPEFENEVMRPHFADVKNHVARKLLANLLLARITTTSGYIDDKMEVADEAKAMALELGIGEGLRSEAMKSVDDYRVVEGVLSGSLKLTRQTQLEKK